MIRIDIQPRLRFHQSDGNSLDPQGLELLQAVHDTGKLTEAAARVGYSYRHAWNLLGKWQAFFGSPLIELYVLYGEVATLLERGGVSPARVLVGNYITSLDMAGASVTVLRADDELLRLWDAPVQTAGLRWGV